MYIKCENFILTQNDDTIISMNSQGYKKIKLPDKPGVYFFYRGKSLLYVGKATSLKDRVKSYFSKDLINMRGMFLVDMVTMADTIKWQETDSVLEALILEADLIKKHQPKYNTKEKDNKSFLCVVITKEVMPQVLVVRQKDILAKRLEYQAVYGPFTSGTQLKEAMKIIRRIFPYRDDASSKKDNYEFYKQLGLTPESSSKEYKKTITNIKLFFQGKKKKILVNLKKEMNTFAKLRKFEDAMRIRNQIFSLNHINDIALIKDEVLSSRSDLGLSRGTTFSQVFRIEAYDIAHMSGKNMVGVMTVVEGGEPNKSEYKKFIIRTQTGANDTGALEEVLARRLRHTEWGMPSLIVLDGSTAQMNVGKRVLDRYMLKIPLVAVVKDDKHKAKAIIVEASSRLDLGLSRGTTFSQPLKKAILLANSEAHRFAITFYRQKSRKNMLK